MHNFVFFVSLQTAEEVEGTLEEEVRILEVVAMNHQEDLAWQSL